MSRGLVDKVVRLCETRGFVVETCLNGPHGPSYAYQYGPLGTELRRNLRNTWWHDVVSTKGNVYGAEITTTSPASTDNILLDDDNGSSCKIKGRRTNEQPSNTPRLRENSFFSMENCWTVEGSKTLSQLVSSVPGLKLPFGVAWNGKCSRTPENDNYLFRSCEEEFMTLQFFCAENKTSDWTNFWKRQRLVWWRKFANIRSSYSLHEDHSDLKPGVNSQTLLEYEFPWGKESLDSLTVRSDLYKDSADDQFNGLPFNKHSLPHVIQIKTDLNKGFLALLMDAYLEKERSDSSGNVAVRTVLRLHPHLAPIKVAVLPLNPQQNELCEVAQQVSSELREAGINTQFSCHKTPDECYGYHDEIGTPYCITILDTTLSNGIVTFRSRNTTLQEFIHMSDILNTVKRHLGM